MNKINVFQEFNAILNETASLLANSQIPIKNFKHESYPEEIILKLNIKEKSPTTAPKFNSLVSKQNLIANADVNIRCRKCTGKIVFIPNFVHKGRQTILVLHYTGNTKKNQPSIPKKKDMIFRTLEEEDLFDRMIRKIFNFPMRDLYYQEIPACSFKPEFSSETDWKNRIQLCTEYIKDTIIRFGIQGVVFMGYPAVMIFGKEKAKEMIGQSFVHEFDDIKMDSIVLRSPEAVLQYEKKSKSFATNKDSQEYKTAKEEENNLKRTIIEELTKFKERIGL